MRPHQPTQAYHHGGAGQAQRGVAKGVQALACSRKHRVELCSACLAALRPAGRSRPSPSNQGRACSPCLGAAGCPKMFFHNDHIWQTSSTASPGCPPALAFPALHPQDGLQPQAVLINEPHH